MRFSLSTCTCGIMGNRYRRMAARQPACPHRRDYWHLEGLAYQAQEP